MKPAASSWHTSFALGIHEVDEEHRDLIECLDRLILAVESRFEQAAVLNALESLAEYTRIHFRVEECLMRLFGYPGLEAHLIEHAAFVEKIAEFRARYVTDENIARPLAAFLTRWLLNHIQTVDKQYVAFFKNLQGPPLIAQQAPA